MEVVYNADLTVLTRMVIQAYESSKRERFLLGITGIPAAGKSTLAGGLMRQVNQVLREEAAIMIPMDGFHYSNERLAQEGLLALKGIPATFDDAGFVGLIRKIRTAGREKIFCPAYDRGLHNPVTAAICVEPGHKIIIVEGNYLLLEAPPWQELTALIDEFWFIDVSSAVSRERLLQRHALSGRSREEALRKIDSTDKPNAELILQTRSRADKIIHLKEREETDGLPKKGNGSHFGE
ncbi:Hypothetical protein LUCI_5034 [Lucifera butyrica]|uniref:Phosphoribulokinase/uridine kinase n=1 Tax=Lucifera butyrica TaxID=1351585 RepID=A0A498RAI9_9FIRM|nr:nucleoside/nucleotide kinase family protein [Lucifera butyrica]VBB09736.1 Hypothetical protein LUCI_5034 [Lucifera butyrica]